MSLLERIAETLLGIVREALKEQTNRILREALRFLVLGVVGVSFLVIGFTFVLIAAATYLSQIMYTWLAWGIVGLITILIGALVLLALKR